MYTFLKFVHLLVAVAIVLLVLVQRGKGAEAGAGFGAGASGTVFGARGAGNALSRATAILVAIFMVTSLSLTYLAAHPVAATATQQDATLDRLAAPATQPSTAPEGSQAPAGAPAPVAPTSK